MFALGVGILTDTVRLIFEPDIVGVDTDNTLVPFVKQEDAKPLILVHGAEIGVGVGVNVGVNTGVGVKVGVGVGIAVGVGVGVGVGVEVGVGVGVGVDVGAKVGTSFELVVI